MTGRNEDVQPRRFRPYQDYRDSGIEWLGEIPAHWEMKRLTDLAVLVNGFPFDSKLFTRSDGIPLVRIRDLFTTATEVNWAGDPVPQAEIRDGDVLIGMDGDFSVAWWAQGLALLNQRLCCVRAGSKRVSQRLLFYCLPFPLKALNDVTYATTVKHLSSLDVLKFRLPLAPPSEQHAIADFLDRETAKIDALVAKKERLIELLQEKRTALITRAVTRGLDPTVPMKDSGVEWLGDIPTHWGIVPAGRLIRSIEQGWSPVAEDRRAARGEWAVIKLSAVSKGSFRHQEHKALPGGVCPDPRYEIREKDFLLTRANTPELVGDVCLVGPVRARLMLCDLVYRVGLIHEKVDRCFLTYWFLSPTGRHQIKVEARGSSRSMVKVSQGIIQSWTVAVPPLDEQRMIAAFLKSETAKIDGLVARVRQAISHLTEYRTALISAAVTGKIDVRKEAA